VVEVLAACWSGGEGEDFVCVSDDDVFADTLGDFVGINTGIGGVGVDDGCESNIGVADDAGDRVDETGAEVFDSGDTEVVVEVVVVDVNIHVGGK